MNSHHQHKAEKKNKTSDMRSIILLLLSFTACSLENITVQAVALQHHPNYHSSISLSASISSNNNNCVRPIPPSSSTSSSTRRSILATILSSSSSLLLVSSSPSRSYAITTPSRISGDDLRAIYDDGASTYESLYSDSIVSKTLDFPTLRSNLLSNASGDVLELGVGTGLNLPHYPKLSPSNINPLSSYSALDISPKMMDQARQKFVNGVPSVAPSLNALYDYYQNQDQDQDTNNNKNKIDFRIGDVANLEAVFGDDDRKFDTIVDTFGLCVFPEPIVALQQARKCLKPKTGKLLLLEHQDSLIGKALNPTRNIADVISTCRYDDDVLGLLKSAGFQNVSYKSYAGGFLLEVIATN